MQSALSYQSLQLSLLALDEIINKGQFLSLDVLHIALDHLLHHLQLSLVDAAQNAREMLV
jgi:hypothetical protein